MDNKTKKCIVNYIINNPSILDNIDNQLKTVLILRLGINTKKHTLEEIRKILPTRTPGKERYTACQQIRCLEYKALRKVLRLCDKIIFVHESNLPDKTK